MNVCTVSSTAVRVRARPFGNPFRDVWFYFSHTKPMATLEPDLTMIYYCCCRVMIENWCVWSIDATHTGSSAVLKASKKKYFNRKSFSWHVILFFTHWNNSNFRTRSNNGLLLLSSGYDWKLMCVINWCNVYWFVRRVKS